MRWIAILGITLATFAGCSLEDALEGAPCDVNDDCVGEQTCVRTAHQTATADLGVCSSDGACVAGEQEGCTTNPDGGCSNFSLFVVCDGAGGACYCCDNQDAVLVVDALDPSSAQCLSGDITNSECDSATDCAGGMGFVCTRTLEQEAESDEQNMEDQEIEPGWCRPDSDPGCAQGDQNGCRTQDSCASGMSQRVTSGSNRFYCCNNPVDTSVLSVHVYAEADGEGTSAACVYCRKDDCMTETCTTLEDPTCVVAGGDLCGCTP